MSGPKRNGNSNGNGNGNGKPRKRTPQGAPKTRAGASTSARPNVALAGAAASSNARYTTTHERTNAEANRHDALIVSEPDERAINTASSTAPNLTSAVDLPVADLPAPPEPPVITHDDIAEPPATVLTATAAIPEAPTAPSAVEKPPVRPMFERPTFGDSATSLRARSSDLARRTWTKLRGYSFEQYLWFGVLFLAVILRFWDLGAKALHHDESMHAYFSLSFANDPASYAYNPLLHGPFQFHAEGIVLAIIIGLEHLFGQAQSWGDPWITDATARIVPAAFGVGIVALPIGLRRELSRPGALLAAFLLAVSPAFVYFSRFLREDIYFNFFMFLMVVAAVRFATSRSLKWFVTLFAATVLAYCTFEGTFLALAIFGGFLAVLFIWELAHSVAPLLPRALTERERAFFSRAGLLVLAGGVGAILAHASLQELNYLSNYIPKHQSQSDTFIANLENQTVAVILYASIVIALVVIFALFWQMYRDDAAYAAQMARAQATNPENPFDESLLLEDAPQPLSNVERVDRVFTAPGRAKANLRARLDPREQPFLRLLLGISWTQWFVAFVAGWMLFAALFWELPGDGRTLGQGFQQGIGQGVWQGIYYWIQQQQVARGGQPWYYYLMLLPLYEQLACVFGIAGIVYSLFRPSRFRLFLVWWFALSFFLYSWAGEKMPWLSIHILLPLMLLAGIALAAVWRGCVVLARQFSTSVRASGWTPSSGWTPAATNIRQWRPAPATAWVLLTSLFFVVLVALEFHTGWSLPLTILQALMLAMFVVAIVRAGIFRPTAAVLGAVLALLLLIPMIHSMLVLAYQDPSNGPHEMMVYVQTTQDVDLVMQKIQQADQALYGGKHELRIGVGPGQEWPFYWYLRDYPNAHFGYNASNPTAPQEDVLILSPAFDGAGTADTSDAFMALHPTGYTAKQYVLRSWWDEAYKPPPCVATKKSACPPSANWGSGVGPGLYFTYGDNPPPHAQFNFSVAAHRAWSWLWTRQAFGNTTGPYYDFDFIVRSGVPIQP